MSAGRPPPGAAGDRRAARVGLLGGSFNPAHAGHLHVATVALRRLALDEIWLLVSPGNPLKPRAGMAPLGERLTSARALSRDRRIIATAIEARIGTVRTVDTVRVLKKRFPRARFVWLMGADNLEQLPHWFGWRELARKVPLAVVPRPGYARGALGGRAAAVLRRHRKRASSARALAGAATPAWVFLPASAIPISATELRRRALTQERNDRATPDHP